MIKDVWRESGGCLRVVWRVSRGCLKGCLDGVLRVSGGYLVSPCCAVSPPKLFLINEVCAVSPPLSVRFFCAVTPPVPLPHLALSWILREVENLLVRLSFFWWGEPIHRDTWPQFDYQFSST